MLRLAKDNGHSQLSRAFPSLGHLEKQLAIGEHPYVFNKWSKGLSVDIGNDLESVEPMLIKGLRRQEGSPPYALSQLLLTNWTIVEKDRPAWHVVCPHCVGGMKTAFWLKSWRLVTTAICPEHQVFLLDRCPECRTRFTITARGSCSLAACSTCGGDIGRMPTMPAGDADIQAASTLSEWLPGCLAISDSQHYNMPLIALRRFLEMLQWPRFAISVLRIYCPTSSDLINLLELRVKPPAGPSTAPIRFSGWPIRERAQILHHLASLVNQRGLTRFFERVTHYHGWRSYTYCNWPVPLA